MNKMLLAIVAFLLVGGFAVYWNATQTRQQSAGQSMEPPDTEGIPQGAPLANVTIPATLSAEAQMGKRGFEARCAECHGTNAAGQNGVAPPLVHKIYEPSHHSDMAFVSAVKNGVRSHHWSFGNMPPLEGLTTANVKMIARYVRELQRANGIN
ncbi:c-type cytochrome [Rhodobacteraceae bacterium 2CG4]|uniref:C-type cytochrome n=1 Tax=Halovulum marinum TaxID=2662447 RepID=A0A6L5YW89_9RHOB|nr:cytochrome c [Halovulum marinum]MSU88477.1 c-type cytochrome [Halovulum marinum]